MENSSEGQTMSTAPTAGQIGASPAGTEVSVGNMPDFTPSVSSSATEIQDSDLESLVSKPGTAHDKLVEISEMPETATSEPEAETLEEEPNEEVELTEETVETTPEYAPETSEQNLIRLQSEALDLATKALDRAMNQKELNENINRLLEEVRELLENTEEKKKKNKFLVALFNLLLFLISIGAKAGQEMQKELKKASS